MNVTRRKMILLSKCAVVFLVIVCLLSGLMSYLISRINVEIDRDPKMNKASDRPPFPSDSFGHVHWFVQISDIHISRFYDRKRGPDLMQFCTENIDVIKPEVVIVSGDLTDAKLSDLRGSRQFEEEWQEYSHILHKSGVTQKTVWLDIRGNHDAFNLPSIDSKDNFHRVYSHRGKVNPRSYMYTHQTADDKFSFIAVDATFDPGPRRPFNFFGMIKKDTMEELKRFSERSRSSNMTFWFGHYTTSTMISPDPGIRSILSDSPVYMCGHLHTLLGLAPRLYTMHHHGNLELEVGDWKDNRIFRVFAVDHGLFSFTDVSFGTWPIVLITNPKHALFNMPIHEPTGRSLRSTHIRILVFSKDPIERVTVAIDGLLLGNARHVKGPLFVLPWKPEDFAHGVHMINVDVKDAGGRQRKIQQPFSLDNTKLPFELFPRLILMLNQSSVVKTLFLAFYSYTILLFLIFRLLKSRPYVRLGGPLMLDCFLQKHMRRLHLLMQTDSVYRPLLLFTLYIAIGPWFVGEIIEGHIGVCFLFGLFVAGSHLPADTTFVYGVFQLITFNLPLMWYLGKLLDRNRSKRDDPPLTGARGSYLRSLWLHWPFIVIVCWQFSAAYHGFLKSYGTMAFILCPLRTWSLFLAFYLRHKAMQVSRVNGHDIGNGDETHSTQSTYS